MEPFQVVILFTAFTILVVGSLSFYGAIARDRRFLDGTRRIPYARRVFSQLRFLPGLEVFSSPAFLSLGFGTLSAFAGFELGLPPLLAITTGVAAAGLFSLGILAGRRLGGTPSNQDETQLPLVSPSPPERESSMTTRPSPGRTFHL